MVVVFHMVQKMELAGLSPLKSLLVRFAAQGHIGVTVFFVLSGFLITTRYAARIEPTWTWAKRYLQNRFARIYPVYFLLTALSLLALALWPNQEFYAWPAHYSTVDKVASALANLTLTRAFFEDFTFTVVPTAWSLTVEECFYVCAPFLLLRLKRNGRRFLLYPALLLGVGVLLVAVCSRLPACYGLMANMRFMLTCTFFGRSTEFMCGMGLALWAAKQPLATARPFPYTALGVGGTGLFMALLAVLHYYSFPGIPASSELPYVQILATSLVLPLLICSLLWGLISEPTRLRSLLATPLFDLLGKSSYVLYLLHLGVFDSLFRQHISSNNFVCLLTYTLVAIAVYKTVEHPLNNRLRAGSLQRAPAPSDAVQQRAYGLSQPLLQRHTAA
jgi:peptidoglycan/LPS O-acetylase OafA/YrhL